MLENLTRRALTLIAAGVLVGAGAAVVPATAAHAAAGCEVTYRETPWSTGFYADVQIKNLGDPWYGYTVQFTFSGNELITSGWNHSWTQTGHEVTVRSSSWAAPVATGQSISLGFVAQYSGTHLPPTNWRVNGIACTIAGQPPAVVAEPTALTVPESGSGSFTVRLSHPPAQSVTLGMSTSGTGIWGMPPIVFVFTPTNWSNPQTVSLFSAPDPDAVDDVAVFVLSAPGYTSDAVTVTQVDDDLVES